MRSLSSTLEAEQKKPSRKPLVKVEVQQFGHPQASSSIQWELFAWEKIFGNSDAQNFHGLAFPSDGSLNRIRLSGTAIHHQRVTSPGPGSTYTSWNTNFGNTIANSHIAIAAHGAEVMVAARGAATLWRRQSSNHGASWSGWVDMTNARPCERGCAIAYKANGDCIIVHASDVNDPTSLYLQKRTSGNWSTGLGQRGSYDGEIEALTAYHDGDWNIIALVLEGNYLSVVRMIYGDGDQVAAGTWGTDQKISLARARVDFSTQLTLRQFKTGWSYASRGKKASIPTYWERHQAVIEALAGESLDVSGPSLWKPSTYSALLSLARGNTPWVYRLKAGSEFIDDQWTKTSPIPTAASYGLALSDDGTYLWATQANEVWRCLLPSSWTPPTPGSGAGSKITIPKSHIARISETIDPEQQSELEVELDNSKGTYDSPGEGDIAYIKRGARVNLHIGYRTATDDLEEVGRYFIESWEYNRSSGTTSFTLNCIDAWGLLQRYAFNKPVEWNVDSNDFTVYELIDKVLEAVDADLSYKSRSSLITSLYPRFDVHAGETAASVISRLLSLVPDVIFFFGLQGYIIYPQASDTAAYKYKFP